MGGQLIFPAIKQKNFNHYKNLGVVTALKKRNRQYRIMSLLPIGVQAADIFLLTIMI